MQPVGESGVEKPTSRKFCVDERGHGEGTGWEARWGVAMEDREQYEEQKGQDWEQDGE
jgi:hypothetical protein